MLPKLENISVLEEAYTEFKNLRVERYNVEHGPIVNNHGGDYIPWKSCSDR